MGSQHSAAASCEVYSEVQEGQAQVRCSAIEDARVDGSHSEDHGQFLEGGPVEAC
jgi:hypothetical protein